MRRGKAQRHRGTKEEGRQYVVIWSGIDLCRASDGRDVFDIAFIECDV